MEKPVASSQALAAQIPAKCSGSTHLPSTPRAMAAPKQMQQPQSMTVLQAGCDHWMTLLHKKIYEIILRPTGAVGSEPAY
ncbi:jg6630 [Pararge aegeria aegeria]|uniref:Jg6630 protein n=1 Tax=Pararge aegeria aegeria TaxID=348720 RepID=A0A8S4RP48_9NEOP|nr:jg6630 [Pararge aegeria aegeria]